MPRPAFDPNDKFLDDADFIFEDDERRTLLMMKMREAAGKGAKRDRAFSEIKNFIEDFNINYSRQEEDRGNIFLSKLFREVDHNGLRWPIAPFLAWLCFYHQGDARELYQKCGLAKKLRQGYRRYIGSPGERSKRRKLASRHGTTASIPSIAPSQFSRIQRDYAMARGGIAFDIDTISNGIQQNLREKFIERRKYIDKIDEFVQERIFGDNDGLLIIRSPSGMGKSSLCAHWCGLDNYDNIQKIGYFFSKSYKNTLDVYRAILYLCNKIEDDFGKNSIIKEDYPGHLMDLLSRDIPYGRSLVIWIDGIDEAQEDMPFILPNALGAGVCLIISARSSDDSYPNYLMPFLNRAVRDRYDVKIIDLSPLSKSEFISLVVDRCSRAGAPMLTDSIVERIYDGTQGIPLISDIIISRWMEGDLQSIYDERHDVWDYDDLGRILLDDTLRDSAWERYDQFFLLICSVREAVSEAFCNLILPPEKNLPSFEILPPSIRRWLRFDQISEGVKRRHISFDHPLIGEIFSVFAERNNRHVLCRLVEAMRYRDDISYEYSLRNRTYHLMELDRIDELIDVVCDVQWYFEMVRILGKRQAFDIASCDLESTMNYAYRFGKLEYYKERAVEISKCVLLDMKEMAFDPRSVVGVGWLSSPLSILMEREGIVRDRHSGRIISKL